MDDEVHEDRRSATPRRKAKLWSGPRRLRRALSREEFAALMDAQAGRCAICCATLGWGRYHDGREPESAAKPAAVDRSPDGLVRGLLCGSCVRALGLLADDPHRLVAAIAYLARAARAAASSDESDARRPQPSGAYRSGRATEADPESEFAAPCAPGRAEFGLVITTRSGRQLDLGDPGRVAELRTDPEVAEALDAYIARAATNRGG